MPTPCTQAHRLQFRSGARERPGLSGYFQRHRDIFQCGHCRNKVEALENHAHIPPTEARQRILVHRGQILTQSRHTPARGPFKPGHQHKE